MSRPGRLRPWLRRQLAQLRGHSRPDSNVVYAKATRVGQRRASELVQVIGTRDPVAVAERRGVNIARDEWGGLTGATLLGDYADGEITIYTRQIESIAVEYDLVSERVETLTIAHELGHHEFDTQRPRILEDTPSAWVQFVRRLLGFQCGPSRRELEEIAAFAFALELVDTEYCPLIRPHLPESARQLIDGQGRIPSSQSEELTENRANPNAMGIDAV